ncbi:MAG: HD domain-containing phosphohydrolase [Candidatus Bipolaricaulota bacterium]
MADVLIVDDERSIRATLAEFIQMDGHQVRTAENSAEALRLLAERAADVVVTDILLPGMDGVELLRRVHGMQPTTQFIVITGEPTVETAAEAVRQGAFDYLSKPIYGDAIQAAVLRAARAKTLIDERRRLEAENEQYREHLEEEVERKTRALQESEERHRAVIENAVEAILVAQDGFIRFANPAATLLSGFSLDALMARPFLEMVHPDDRPLIEQRYRERLEGTRPTGPYAFRILRNDGEERWAEVRAVRFEWDGAPATLSFLRDVTQERAARLHEEIRRRQIESLTRALVEIAVSPRFNAPDLDAAYREATEIAAVQLDVERVSVWRFAGDGEHARCVELYERGARRHSSGAPELLDPHPRYSAALHVERVIAAGDAVHDPRTSEFAPDYFRPLGIGATLDAGIRRGGMLVGILCCEHVGGPRAWTAEEAEFAGSLAGLVAVALEADERRRAEAALERRELEYRSLFEDSPVSLFVEDFSRIQRSFESLRAQGVVDLGAYLDAHPEVIDELIASIAVVDVNEAAVRLHGAKNKQDLLARVADHFHPASKPDFRSRLLSIWRGERLFDVTTVDTTLDGKELFTALRWSIPPGREETLDQVLLAKTDITSLVESESRIRRALDGTIEAIGRATETRDPYTAGHQRRVTELAVPIAEVLGLSEDRVAATHAAGLLHDIGKLSIPAEILTKPSRLSPMETALIRVHPQSAYDILKTVEFPWPIAEIVLQHHERLDGSGYPLGLRGGEILLEARILAVADVVEAMASHRPYRPALGIEAALDEVKRGRATLYDAGVVDACLELFRDHGFRFS